MLTARHATLDIESIPAFLQASGSDSRRLYLRHGKHRLRPRIDLPGGTALYTVWRKPRNPQDAEGQR
jgi:hypothetical protein